MLRCSANYYVHIESVPKSIMVIAYSSSTLALLKSYNYGKNSKLLADCCLLGIGVIIYGIKCFLYVSVEVVRNSANIPCLQCSTTFYLMEPTFSNVIMNKPPCQKPRFP